MIAEPDRSDVYDLSLLRAEQQREQGNGRQTQQPGGHEEQPGRAQH